MAPASADFIAKASHGIADDMLTTVLLAAKCKKIVAPAMNTGMLLNPITLDNIKRLKHYDFEVIEPDEGFLACGGPALIRTLSPAISFSKAICL